MLTVDVCLSDVPGHLHVRADQPLEGLHLSPHSARIALGVGQQPLTGVESPKPRGQQGRQTKGRQVQARLSGPKHKVLSAAHQQRIAEHALSAVTQPLLRHGSQRRGGRKPALQAAPGAAEVAVLVAGGGASPARRRVPVEEIVHLVRFYLQGGRLLVVDDGGSSPI